MEDGFLEETEGQRGLFVSEVFPMFYFLRDMAKRDMKYGSLFPSTSVPQSILPENSLRTKDPLLPSLHLQPLVHSLLSEGLLNE